MPHVYTVGEHVMGKGCFWFTIGHFRKLTDKRRSRAQPSLQSTHSTRHTGTFGDLDLLLTQGQPYCSLHFPAVDTACVLPFLSFLFTPLSVCL